jgi:L-rhamnose mutarotase
MQCHWTQSIKHDRQLKLSDIKDTVMGHAMAYSVAASGATEPSTRRRTFRKHANRFVTQQKCPVQSTAAVISSWKSIDSGRMQRVAFKMYLKKGFEEEYKKRHDEIWPELSQLLAEAGISDYSIFLDSETNTLFAVHKLASASSNSQDLGANAIVQQWWRYMADIMETNPDSSPVSVPLKEVFYHK